MRLLFDIEANGYLDTVSKIHCIETEDLDTGDCFGFGPNEIEEGLELLEKAGVLVGHNIIGYDIPTLQKIYPSFNPKSELFDTLVVSRLIYTNLFDLDIRKKRKLAKYKKQHPFEGTKLWGSHSLEAWGLRLGVLKGDYGEQEQAFDEWTPEMQEYCAQDVQVTKALYNLLINKEYDQRAVDIELKFQKWMSKMEQHGWVFDEERALQLFTSLSKDINALEEELQEIFPPLEIRIPFTPKATNKKLGYQKGVPTEKVKYAPFNPSSDQQIAERLIQKYGWKPKEFTPSGKPKVSEEILESLPYPEVEPLCRHKKMTKVQGRVFGWLEAIRDGKVYAGINTNGTVTGRCTHRVIVNVSRVKKNKETGELLYGYEGGYGADQRSLFTVPNDAKDPWVLLGADASGLELRCLSHYMARYDGGEYVKVVTEGDPHTMNQRAMGLSTRDEAKTKIYAHNYGAGDAKLGDGDPRLGKKRRAALKKNLPALGKVVDKVQAIAQKRGYIIAIDGRRVYTGKRTALNYLLQSCGSIIVKKATILFCEKMATEFTWGEEWAIVGHFHDEFQVQVRQRIVERAKELALESFKESGEFFKFRCPIEGDVKVGLNWAETH